MKFYRKITLGISTLLVFFIYSFRLFLDEEAGEGNVTLETTQEGDATLDTTQDDDGEEPPVKKQKKKKKKKDKAE